MKLADAYEQLHLYEEAMDHARKYCEIVTAVEQEQQQSGKDEKKKQNKKKKNESGYSLVELKQVNRLL